MGRGVCVFRAKKYQRFTDLTYRANYERLLSFTTGSTFPNWDRQTLSEYKIIIPSGSTIQVFETLIEKIFKHIENLSEENTSLITLNDILHSKLATTGN